MAISNNINGATNTIRALKDEMAKVVSAVQGKTDSGQNDHPHYDAEGHIEVAVHSPRLPFGSIHTESLEPIFQVDSVYGINSEEMLTTIGHLTGGVSSATATGTDNLFK